MSILGGAAATTLSEGCARQKSPASPNASRAEHLAERILEHVNAAYYTTAAYIGDRLGLFRALADNRSYTAKQLAEKTGLNERYLLEWLRTMASAQYLDYQAESGAFVLPPEHAAVLVDEDSPSFSAGLVEGTVPDIFMALRVMAAFRTGHGIPYGDYPPEVFDATERLTKPEYAHLLTQRWLASIPGTIERLRAGGSTADLGCGAGLASIAIARAFPLARAFGFEPYEPNVVRARENAATAGLAVRVRFDTFDGVHVPGGPYDLITMNYVLHHAGKPVNLLRSVRQALASRGALLVVEYRKSTRLEDDIGTLRGGIYGFGLLECLPTALAEGAPGYGTGITEPDMRELAANAGFHEFRRVLPDDQFRSFFVFRA